MKELDFVEFFHLCSLQNAKFSACRDFAFNPWCCQSSHCALAFAFAVIATNHSQGTQGCIGSQAAIQGPFAGLAKDSESTQLFLFCSGTSTCTGAVFPTDNVRLFIRIHYEIKFCIEVLTQTILTRFSEYVVFVYLLIQLWIEGYHPNCGRQ